LWWYQGRGRIYANEFLNKLYLISDALFKRRTDGALVRVHSPIYANEQQALDDQLAFVKEIMPILERYIPD
jgi:EpsI family protein